MMICYYLPLWSIWFLNETFYCFLWRASKVIKLVKLVFTLIKNSLIVVIRKFLFFIILMLLKLILVLVLNLNGILLNGILLIRLKLNGILLLLNQTKLLLLLRRIRIILLIFIIRIKLILTLTNRFSISTIRYFLEYNFLYIFLFS